MNLTTMKRFLCLSNLWILLAMPLAAGTARIYVTNNAGTTISVIDPVTNKIVQEIGDVEVPMVARFSPDGSRAYITYLAENVLRVVDAKTGKFIKNVPLSGHPNDIAVTRDGKLVLVCIHETPGVLDIIDTAKLEKVRSIPAHGYLHDIDVTADGKYAVAGSPAGKTATVFDLQSNQIAWEIQLGQAVQPLVIESGPDGAGRRIFLQLHDLNGFSVVDFATHKEVTRIKLPDEPGGFPWTGATCHGIGISPDGKTLWANSGLADAVFAYSLPDLKLLGHVSLPKLNLPGRHAPIPAGPNWLTFTPDSKKIYITNTNLKSVTVIDVNAMKVAAVIPVGERPGRISTLVVP